MTEGYQPVNNGKMPAKPTTGSDAYNVNKVVIVPQEVIEELSKSMIKIIDEIDWNVLINKCLERPKGEWIFTEYMVWKCSNCGGNPHTGTGFVPDTERMKRQWKYCNLCGASMRGGQDNG